MTRTAVYLRVSTRGQADEDKFGLDVQAAQVREYAQRHNLTLTDTYTDQITGTRHRREQLDALLDRAEAYDAVIISSVDRLGRRNRITYAVLDELLDTGVALHSADMGPIDPEDENSMLQFGVRSLFAENDHRRLVQKLYRAKVAKVAGNPATGKVGRPANPLNCYGWRDDQIVPHERQWVQYMYQRLQTVGTQTLARELHEQGVLTRNGATWTPTKLRLLIRRATYKGTYEFGRADGRDGEVKASCPVEPFVTPEVWEAANQGVRARNAKTQVAKVGRLKTFPLTGHIRCGHCKRSMVGGHNGRKHYGYYRCASSSQTVVSRTGMHCDHRRGYRADQINALVEGTIRSLSVAGVRLTELLPPQRHIVPDHQNALSDLGRRMDRLEAAYMAGAYTPGEYAERRAQLHQQRDAITNAPVAVPIPLLSEQALCERIGQALEQELPDLADTLGLTVFIDPGGEIRLQLNPPITVT